LKKAIFGVVTPDYSNIGVRPLLATNHE